jgi:hypothetical protein
MLISQQAQASQQFAESMNLMAQEIGRVFGEMDLTKTQAQWERAVAQAGSMEERMEIFLDSMETSAVSAGEPASAGGALVTDDEIDRMIQPTCSRPRKPNSASSTNWRAKSPRNWARPSRRTDVTRARQSAPGITPGDDNHTLRNPSHFPIEIAPVSPL